MISHTLGLIHSPYLFFQASITSWLSMKYR
jgi:hypothetical protein